ncbi:MAG TPA: hypothetical protein PKI05_09280, partial [Thermogutta sp.]|nr:hypothetical protein [Thermogutta sp.]
MIARIVSVTIIVCALLTTGQGRAVGQALSGKPSVRNVILLVSDDHRYDFLGFMAQSPSFL